MFRIIYISIFFLFIPKLCAEENSQKVQVEAKAPHALSAIKTAPPLKLIEATEEWNAAEAQKYVKESPDLNKVPCIIFRDIWDGEKLSKLKTEYETELAQGYQKAFEDLNASFKKPGSITALEGENACLPLPKDVLGKRPAVTPAIESNYYGVTLHHTLSIPADGPWWVQQVHEKWADIGYHFIVAKSMPTEEEMEQQLLDRQANASDVIKASRLSDKEKSALLKTLDKSTKEGIRSRKKIWPKQRELFYAAVRAAKSDPRNAFASCDEKAGWFIFQGRPTQWQGAHVGSANLRVVPKAEAPDALKNTQYPLFEVSRADAKTQRESPVEFDENHEVITDPNKRGKKRYLRFNEPDATHLMVVDENNNPIHGVKNKTISHVTVENFLTQLLLASAEQRNPNFKFEFDPSKLPPAPALDNPTGLMTALREKELKRIFSQLEEGQILESVGLNNDKIGITLTGSFAPIDPLDPNTYAGYTENAPETKRIPEQEAMRNVGQLINHLFQNKELSHIGSHRTGETGDNPMGGCCPGPGAMCMVKGMIDRFIPAAQN